MSNLNNRIYNELSDWKYYESYLIGHVRREKNKINTLNTLLIFISLLGIAGWFWFSNLKMIWFCVLLAAQGVRIIQSLKFTTHDEIFNFKKSAEFYSFHLLELENLYYDYFSGKFKESTIEKRLKSLTEKERNHISLQKNEKLPERKNIQKAAENISDSFLLKIKANVSNE